MLIKATAKKNCVITQYLDSSVLTMSPIQVKKGETITGRLIELKKLKKPSDNLGTLFMILQLENGYFVDLYNKIFTGIKEIKLENMKKLTLTELLIFYKSHSLENDVKDTLTYAYSYRLPYPAAPKKPLLKHEHNVEDVRKYLTLFEKYETEYIQYQAKKTEFHKVENEINSIIKDFLWEISGLNKAPSFVNKEKFWLKAYEEGHSDGMYRVYLSLAGLVDLFT